MLLFFTLACKPPVPTDPTTPLTCQELLDGGPSATTEAHLQVLLDQVRDNLFPELEDVRLEMRPNQSETSYFSANLDAATLESPPLERSYLVHYSTLQFPDPPPADAVTAILAHELTHVRDYTLLTSDEMIAFGIRYATEPIDVYERQTDEHALELGCGEGLILFREWLYDHVSPEVEAQKRIDYYTPDEIRTWIDTH